MTATIDQLARNNAIRQYSPAVIDVFKKEVQSGNPLG
jgi:hypothetical protein